jgi:hypothetical protein
MRTRGGPVTGQPERIAAQRRQVADHQTTKAGASLHRQRRGQATRPGDEFAAVPSVGLIGTCILAPAGLYGCQPGVLADAAEPRSAKDADDAG